MQDINVLDTNNGVHVIQFVSEKRDFDKHSNESVLLIIQVGRNV